jgi:hypothetical protein
MDINDLLNKKQFEIGELLRVNQIMKPGLDGIKEGYEKYGDTFIMKVVDTLKDSTNNFKNFDPLTSDPDLSGFIDSSMANQAATLRASNDAVNNAPVNISTTSDSGLFNSILGVITQVGKTASALTSKTTPTTYSTILPTNASSIMFYLAGAAILAIILILILKK